MYLSFLFLSGRSLILWWKEKRPREGLPKATQSPEYNTTPNQRGPAGPGPGISQSECSLITCHLIGGRQAHLARQLISPWKEEPLGVCWLTGKVLTRGGRRGKPEPALAENLRTSSLGVSEPHSSQGRGEGVQGYLQPVSLVEACSYLQGCSGLILQSGAPPTPHPPPLPRSGSLCSAKGGESWGSFAH